ncbi:protease FtsH-inhibitory lysogeny factor CIII [Pantoea endophytica]|uniref:protease FtsH-inhibitory lysogeny factor CIII n=1 Tax=Pantoea endophytica TaxID=92488 RepID=UPI0030B85B1B
MLGFFFPTPTNLNFQEPMMNYAIVGGPVVGFTQHNESQLDRLVRRLRSGWRSLIDTLNQPGNPL